MSASRSSNLVPQLFERQFDSNINKFRSNLFRERFRIAKNLYKYDLVSHYGCVNAIEFSNGGEFLISGGDDKRVLLWHLEKALAGKGSPVAMEKQHQSNIFCLSFNNNNSRIFSGGNDDIVIVHDVATGSVCDVFLHAKPIYGLSIDTTNDNILATAGEDGHVLLFDQRKGAVVMTIGKYRGPFHAVQFHPQDGNYLVTANSKTGAAFWDIRKSQTSLIQYGGEENPQSCMSIRFNTHGSQVLALRRRLPPILYNTFSQDPVCQFYHPDYYNSCTMKSCCFAGEEDEFVLSGSDDFNLYVWRVGDVDPEITSQWIEQTQMVLYGHRSIVNQVRYNPQKCLLASSGVEKIVKLWSPFDQKDWTGSLIEEAAGPENPREVFTHEAYYSLVNMNSTDMTHDYSNQNTREDPRMMAFFDSLIQQEIESWNSNSLDTDEWSNRTSDNSTRQSSTESSDEVNFFIGMRNRRRGVMAPAIKPQRNKYANRIAYLIATKRNTLKRLALKGASQSNRHRQSNLKLSKRRGHCQRTTPRTTRSGVCLKRVGRFNLPTRHKSQNNAQTTQLRCSRRKCNRSCRTLENFDSSSDDDDDAPANRGDDLTGNASSNGAASSSSGIAVPSTSTGITSNAKDIIYCLRQQQVDSDDDNTPINSDNEPERPSLQSRDGPKIPINGFHNKPAIIDTRNRTAETANGNQSSSDPDEDHRQPSTSNVRRRPHINTVAEYGAYSSHSNSRLSNSSCLDQDDSSSDDSSGCYRKKQKLVPNTNNNNGNNSNVAESSSSRSQDNRIENGMGLTEAKTPNSSNNIKVGNSFNYTPDSGISSNTAGCSSSGSVTSQIINNNNNNYSNQNINASNINGNNNNLPANNDKFSLKLFQQKVARVRRNYRNKFADDSDSD